MSRTPAQRVSENARRRRSRAKQAEQRRAAQLVGQDLIVDEDAETDTEMLPDEEEELPMAIAPERMHWTRFTVPGMGYFTYRGQNYDRGQLIELTGGPRDEQLERLGYVQLAPKSEAHLQAECGVCGRWFLTEQFRDQHGRLRHSDRFQTDLEIGGGMAGPDGGAALRDVTGDAEERRMQQQYPLYLDRSRATLDSSPA